MGTLSDAVAALSRAFDTVADALRNAEPMTWGVITIVAALLWLLFRR